MKPEERSTEQLCRHYVTYSYMYYQLDCSVISDTDFDMYCKELLKRYNEISEYWKRFISKESLTAGSGFDINFIELPTRIKVIAYTLKDKIDTCGNEIKMEDWLG